ncbi:unnamed protein product [Ixodes hexagonus]
MFSGSAARNEGSTPSGISTSSLDADGPADSPVRCCGGCAGTGTPVSLRTRNKQISLSKKSSTFHSPVVCSSTAVSWSPSSVLMFRTSATSNPRTAPGVVAGPPVLPDVVVVVGSEVSMGHGAVLKRPPAHEPDC